MTSTMTIPTGNSQSTYAEIAEELGPQFAARAAGHDADDSFVAENFEEMRRHKLFSAAIPVELGGGGATHREMCAVLRGLARHDSSTGLSFAMHSHMLATLSFRVRHNMNPSSEPALHKIAAEELALVSSGGSDWLDGSGTLVKVEGGYRFNARKVFGSSSPAGDLLVTTGVYDDPASGPSVLHFLVNLRGEGVSVQDDWHTMGMRGTGSNSIVIEDVFIPEGEVSLSRPQGVWHKRFDIIAPLAFSLIMSVYLGIAESARDIAVKQAAMKKDDPILLQGMIGAMDTELLAAQCFVNRMVGIASSEFQPSHANSNEIARLKTLATNSAIKVVERSMEVAGGQGYFRGLGLERRFRDVQAARYHPIQEAKQYVFSGRIALGLDPVG